MKLVFDAARSRFELLTTWGEVGVPEVPKAAGLRWDPACKRWHGDALKAAALREYADEATIARLDAAIEAAIAAKAAAEEAARAVVAASRAQDAEQDYPCAPGRSYLPYQRAGIAYALAHRNCLLGDDMGLGKTAQAIGVLNSDESMKRILVICPSSLSRNWVREFGFFGSRGLSVGIATTTKLPATDVVVATYSIFSMSGGAAQTELLAHDWDALILDEAHYCKSADAKRTQRILGGKGEPGIRVRSGGRRMYLTGTPIPNRPVEAWPLLSSLAPAEFGNWATFVKRYCSGYRGDYGWDVSGASNLAELQDKMRATCMVRRLKADVLTELPAKRRQIIEMAATTPQLRKALKAEAEAQARHDAEKAKLEAAKAAAKATDDKAAYAAAVAALASAGRVEFTEMSRVRHETAVAKAPMVAEHVRDALEGGDGKIIVFGHHRDVIDILRKDLADYGCVEVTGDTPVADRQDAVDAFQANPAVRVFLGNIQAAGVGLTLTASSHVVFAELDWVPGNISQAEDRAHRIGQQGSVLIQHLVLEGSMDADMARTITEKQDVIDSALDAQDAPVAAEEPAVAEVSPAEAATPEEQIAAPAEAEPDEGQARRRAEWLSAMDDAILAAFAGCRETALPSEAACARILEALGELAAGGVFSPADRYFGHYLAALPELSGPDAVVGRAFVRRYRHRLDAGLVAAALEEPAGRRVLASDPDYDDGSVGGFSNPLVRGAVALREIEDRIAGEAMMTPPPGTEIPFPKRRRGRPSNAASGKAPPLSQVERNRRYRARRDAAAAVTVPRELADRLSAARGATGMTTAQLLAAALDAIGS